MRKLELRSARNSGIAAVFNLVTGEVERQSAFKSGIVGYFDSATQTVKFEQARQSGIAVAVPHADGYFTSSSYLYLDED